MIEVYVLYYFEIQELDDSKSDLKKKTSFSTSAPLTKVKISDVFF